MAIKGELPEFSKVLGGSCLGVEITLIIDQFSGNCVGCDKKFKKGELVASPENTDWRSSHLSCFRKDLRKINKEFDEICKNPKAYWHTRVVMGAI